MQQLLIALKDGVPTGHPLLLDSVRDSLPAVHAAGTTAPGELAALGYALCRIDAVPLVPDGHHAVASAFTESDSGEWVQSWLVEPVPVDRDSPMRQIDSEVDALYGAVLGNRAAEYELAEREALAYAQASYTGTAPASVQAWATAKGWTGTQAADDIIAQAAQWRGAQAAIRAQRLLRKEQVRTAADASEVAAAVAAWNVFLAGMRQALGA